MARRTAVIDKSLLQAICELAKDSLDHCFNALLSEFVLVVPSVLIEEVWADWSHPERGRNETTKNLVCCLDHLRDAWVAEPLHMAFHELVEQKPLDELPKCPAYIMDSFLTLNKGNPQLRRWFAELRVIKDKAIAHRLFQQRSRLGNEESIVWKVRANS
jgi:hypothetical protein